MKTQARRKEIKSDLGINREKEKKKEVFIIIMHVCFIKSVRERSREGYRRGQRKRERETERDREIERERESHQNYNHNPSS